jgi:hypothetical protein
MFLLKYDSSNFERHLTFKNCASYIWDRRTATLQMLHFIYFSDVAFYIFFSINICTEYFEHAAHSLFFSSKCRLFHNATFFGSSIIHILHTGYVKFECETPMPKGYANTYCLENCKSDALKWDFPVYMEKANYKSLHITGLVNIVPMVSITGGLVRNVCQCMIIDSFLQHLFLS